MLSLIQFCQFTIQIITSISKYIAIYSNILQFAIYQYPKISHIVLYCGRKYCKFVIFQYIVASLIQDISTLESVKHDPICTLTIGSSAKSKYGKIYITAAQTINNMLASTDMQQYFAGLKGEVNIYVLGREPHSVVAFTRG